MSVETFDFEQPTVSVKQPYDFLFRSGRTSKRIKNYFVSLFPVAGWIYRYNLTWLYGDLIAGITTGVVVVPQGMSYAKIAGLPVQYGLYSGFIGNILYSLTATSKDVCIGPVAVMSSQVYTVTHRVLKRLPHLTQKDAPEIATLLALFCGFITFGLGILRLGFILEYIPMPAVMGFMSGSAFTILVGQVPSLLGIQSRLNTHDAGYLVVVNTLKELPHCDYNAAMGIICLFLLYAMKFGFGYLEKRDRRHRLVWFYLNNLRTAVIIIFSTLISWGIHRLHPGKLSIIKTVPRGFKDMGVHPIRRDVLDAMAPDLAISVVVLVLEHISISKSFGRINGYRVNPAQELIAIGISNMVGHFFAAYPNTGSFSRSALKNKCGVRTPLSGVFTGLCVLVAIYGLVDAFYYISNAAIAAVIIHCVADLIASYKATYLLWIVSPVELVIFIVDIILCVFVSLEAGIYFAAAASLVNLLLKQTFPLGQFLGRVEYVKVPVGNNYKEKDIENIHELHEDHLSISADNFNDRISEDVAEDGISPVQLTKSAIDNHGEIHSKWWPLNHDNINPDIRVVPPPPGILVYRPRESITYQNISWHQNRITNYVRKHTRPNLDSTNFHLVKLGDRPWNEYWSPRNLKPVTEDDNRPVLRALVFDMSSSPNVDVTGAQGLVDLHSEVTKYAASPVEFHFAGIMSEWSRRALYNSGFGGAKTAQPPRRNIELGFTNNGDADRSGLSSDNDGHIEVNPEPVGEYTPEKKRPTFAGAAVNSGQSGHAPVVDTETIFFHFDIPDLE